MGGAEEHMKLCGKYHFQSNLVGEEKNCRPSPHCLDLSRRYGFPVPPGRTDLLRRYSFSCFA